MPRPGALLPAMGSSGDSGLRQEGPRPLSDSLRVPRGLPTTVLGVGMNCTDMSSDKRAQMARTEDNSGQKQRQHYSGFFFLFLIFTREYVFIDL